MIKALLFDFDGVLTIDKTGSASITKYISEACNIPLEWVRQCYYQFNKKLLTGEVTHIEIWQEFCDALGQEIGFQILLGSFQNTLLDEKMMDLVKGLKEKYLIALVTDNKSDRIDTIMEYNKISTYFDLIAVSAALHYGKEDSRIFQYVLVNLKVKAEECVFIDNAQKNLFIPKQMGMKTILFDDTARDFGLFKSCLETAAAVRF